MLETRIQSLIRLGKEMTSKPDWLETSVQKAYYENQWFTEDQSWKALNAIAEQFLEEEKLRKWVNENTISDSWKQKRIGLVFAGNIPLVGFHDLLCTYISGYISVIKLSSKDSILIKALIDRLIEIDRQNEAFFECSERLANFDAVIATGSNNSSRYFEDYFGKYPNIIRRNRNGVAVLSGNEEKLDIIALGHDIFSYYGLGCRNVSKIYVPEDYNFDFMLGILHDEFKMLANHNKYRNNLDYNNSLFLLNRIDYLMSGSLILVESKDIVSRIATLHYERYSDVSNLEKDLTEKGDEIQCIASKIKLNNHTTVPFGGAQQPLLNDYADGIDTLAFLKSLND